MGNNKDQRSAPQNQGDWSKIYPLNNLNIKLSDSGEGDIKVRLCVHNMTKFTKTWRQIHQNHGELEDEQLNRMLMNQLGLSGKVWLPYK